MEVRIPQVYLCEIILENSCSTSPQAVSSGSLGALYSNLWLQLSSLVISQHSEQAIKQYGLVGISFS